jgi:DNA polymerase-4
MMSIDRWIAHVDMDAFYASIEIRDDPSLSGKPVVVGGSRDDRGVVSASSYEARRFGVHSAMPMARAEQLCPSLIRLPVNMEKYASVSERVMAVLGSFSPLVEPLSLDEAFLDLTGTERIFGSPEAIGRRIKDEILDATALIASVGIAPRKFVAKIASDLRKPDGLVIVGQGEVKEFLSRLPIARLWGVGPKTLARLQELGIETVGGLRNLSRETLASHFGLAGEHLQRLACGEDERGVVPEWEAKSYSHEETFARNRDDRDFLRAVLCDQASRVARRLRRAGVVGRVVTIKLRYGDFTTITRRRKISHATSLTEPIYEESCRLFEANWNGRPIRLLGVGVTDIEVPEGEPSLFPEPLLDSRRRALAETIDRLQEKFGSRKIVRAQVLRREKRGD